MGPRAENQDPKKKRAVHVMKPSHLRAAAECEVMVRSEVVVREEIKLGLVHSSSGLCSRTSAQARHLERFAPPTGRKAGLGRARGELWGPEGI